VRDTLEVGDLFLIEFDGPPFFGFELIIAGIIGSTPGSPVFRPFLGGGFLARTNDLLFPDQLLTGNEALCQPRKILDVGEARFIPEFLGDLTPPPVGSDPRIEVGSAAGVAAGSAAGGAGSAAGVAAGSLMSFAG
jgi:hypothetical protein